MHACWAEAVQHSKTPDLAAASLCQHSLQTNQLALSSPVGHLAGLAGPRGVHVVPLNAPCTLAGILHAATGVQGNGGRLEQEGVAGSQQQH